jgi:hypothetical protein
VKVWTFNLGEPKFSWNTRKNRAVGVASALQNWRQTLSDAGLIVARQGLGNAVAVVDTEQQPSIDPNYLWQLTEHLLN